MAGIPLPNNNYLLSAVSNKYLQRSNNYVQSWTGTATSTAGNYPYFSLKKTYPPIEAQLYTPAPKSLSILEWLDKQVEEVCAYGRLEFA